MSDKLSDVEFNEFKRIVGIDLEELDLYKLLKSLINDVKDLKARVEELEK